MSRTGTVHDHLGPSAAPCTYAQWLSALRAGLGTTELDTYDGPAGDRT
jgi:hypothetical protein